MLAVTLGTQASGSTWLYNVVRALFGAAKRVAFSASADNGVDALDQLPFYGKDGVLKCHALDQRLLKLIRLADARVIITTRDARDSVVSQRERFGLPLIQAVTDISRAFATIGSLPSDLPTLRFDYEDRFMEREETIHRIADFLGLAVRPDQVKAIFVSLLPDAVRSLINRRLANFPPDHDPGHDPETQWHSTHVGDGKSGKWREGLTSTDQRSVSGCLSMMSSAEIWHREAIRWLPSLFRFNEGYEEPRGVLDTTKVDDFIVYGPYLCLPRGRWRAAPIIRSMNIGRVEVDADIHFPWEDRTAACARNSVLWYKRPHMALEFDHYDYYQPIEARLRRVKGCDGDLSFGGWNLRWLGEI